MMRSPRFWELESRPDGPSQGDRNTQRRHASLKNLLSGQSGSGPGVNPLTRSKMTQSGHRLDQNPAVQGAGSAPPARFRTIQVGPKDFPAPLREVERAV